MNRQQGSAPDVGPLARGSFLGWACVFPFLAWSVDLPEARAPRDVVGGGSGRTRFWEESDNFLLGFGLGLEVFSRGTLGVCFGGLVSRQRWLLMTLVVAVMCLHESKAHAILAVESQPPDECSASR